MSTINQDDLRRAMEDLAAAQLAGFTPKQTIYPIGTPVVQLGVDNFKQSRQQWDDSPMPHEALSELIDRIESENRRDVLVEAPDTYIRDGFLMHGLSNESLNAPMSKQAFYDLCTWVAPGGGPSYLRECPQAMREEHINFWLKKAYEVDKRASKKEGKMIFRPKRMKLRMRDGEGIFGLTGPRHTSFDLDKIALQLIDKIKGDARCNIIYNGYKATIDLIYHSNIIPQDAVAGEFFKSGLRIEADDAGHGSIRVKLLLWRNLCLNLIVIDFNKLLIGSRRHQGQIKDIATDLDIYIDAAQKKLSYFVDKWNEATAENILEKYNLQDVDECFHGLVYNKVVHISGVHPDEMIERLHRAWEVEPGYSKASVLNAITRAAHTESWGSYEDTEELESTVGEMLFAKVWNVAIPEGIEDLV